MREIIVHGSSMWPTFRDGERLLMAPLEGTPLEGALRVGQVVVAEHPFKRGVLMVKRIARVEADGRLFLEGDNPDPLASEDSHNFGSVGASALLGVITED